jgi:chromosome segregation ATPase
MSYDDKKLCNEVIKLQTQVNEIEKRFEDMQFDRRAQDGVLRHVDKLLNEVRSQYENLNTLFQELKEKTRGISVMKNQIEELRKDFDEHEKQHKDSQKVISDRNWKLWVILITATLGSIAGLIVNIIRG